MTDATQILLVAAITVMTVILTIIGIQLFFVLKDIRILLTRANSILAEIEHFGTDVKGSFSEMVGVVSNLKRFYSLIELLGKKKKQRKYDET